MPTGFVAERYFLGGKRTLCHSKDFNEHSLLEHLGTASGEPTEKVGAAVRRRRWSGSTARTRVVYRLGGS
jgi:hypothetical protein